jgi:hypothetical protein
MKNEKSKAFFRLFFRRELGPLLGDRYYNLFILVLILFISFSVIGFAEGSLRYLESKMKDPFINWVNVIPGPGREMGVGQIIEQLNKQDVREQYFLINAIGYNRFQLNFYDYSDIQNYYRTGNLNNEKITGIPARTLDEEDPVKKEIFAKKNLVFGSPPEDNMDIGLVVTSDFLKRLNYPSNTPYVWMDFLALKQDEGSELRVAIPVPVNAVVKSLPGMTGFAASSYFYQQRNLVYGSNPFNPINDGRLVLAFHGDEERLEALNNSIAEELSEMDVPGGFSFNNILSEPGYRTSPEPYSVIYIHFSPRGISLDALDEVFLRLFDLPSLAPYRANLYRLYDYERRFTVYRETSEYDRISLNFSNLDKLREFSAWLQEQYQIEVDMAQIESRENYNFVSRLTGIISVVLIAFSILSVLLFMAHLLKRHLEGIKRNLGTFKAFGLPNKLLIRIYLQLILAILFGAVVISLFLSALFGYSGGWQLVLYLFRSKFEPGSYFSLASVYLLVALLMLVVFSVIVLRLITNKILNHTPGDLIYERD